MKPQFCSNELFRLDNYYERIVSVCSGSIQNISTAIFICEKALIYVNNEVSLNEADYVKMCQLSFKPVNEIKFQPIYSAESQYNFKVFTYNNSEQEYLKDSSKPIIKLICM